VSKESVKADRFLFCIEGEKNGLWINKEIIENE